MGNYKPPRTKAELIAHYGEEWYERFKERNRQNAKERYAANPDAERQRHREKRRKFPETSRAYSKRHREIYRINCRDRSRLKIMGVDLEGKEVHHLKYHKDNKDASWIDDILILSKEEHALWHIEHPDFSAEENVI